MRTLAIYLPNWIGDVVMATPAIRAIRAHYAHAKIIAVCKPYVADVIEGSNWFDRVLHWDKRSSLRPFGSLLTTLRHAKVDASVLFPNSFRSACLARLSGSVKIVGFARYGRDFLLTHRLYAARDSRGRFRPTPIVDDYNRLALRLGVPDTQQFEIDQHRLELFTTGGDEEQATSVWSRLQLTRFQRVIGLNPGGAFGSSKHWSNESFARVARSFAEQGFGVLVLCGPAEREAARHITSLSGHSSVTSLGDSPLSLGLTKALVKRLSLMVTTDSGPRHFAVAFRVPVLTLFGPTHIEWTESYFEHAVNLQKKLACGPCQQRVCPLGHHQCMTELTPELVIQESMLMIARSSVQPRESRHVG